MNTEQILDKLKTAIVKDHYIDDVYYDLGYICYDFTLTTNVGKFIVKNLLLFEAEAPEGILLSSYRSGFGVILKDMTLEQEDDIKISFIPL